MELFPKEFVPELVTKNLENSMSFLTITHMTMSATRFRRYGILTINITVIFCFWTEQRRDESSISRLGLVETLEVLSTISGDNSLSFPMVH
jgi:hypothetical protein